MTAADKIWRKTHPDFRATFQGVRYIMRTVGGALTFVSVDELARVGK